MKKKFFISSFFILLATTFLTSKKPLEKFSKDSISKKKGVTVVSEIKTPLVQQVTDQTPKRFIASLKQPTLATDTPRLLKIGNRRIINRGPISQDLDTSRLTFLNQPDSSYKEILEENVSNFQKASTKVQIEHEESLVEIRGLEALYIEKVLVIYTLKNGEQSSFHAKVDGETGKIISTWDHTLKEKNPLNQLTLSLKPLTSL
ncbi:MAG: hypothetical protein KBD63_05925 [Bacteriovoracaceae bacterium]|nr:hypothetical protein [Bacteriovoracaceae bacterium]